MLQELANFIGSLAKDSDFFKDKLPVIDKSRRPVGVVTRTDIVLDRYDWAELRDEMLSRRPGSRTLSGVDGDDELHINELLRSRTGGDLMSRQPVVVTETSPIRPKDPAEAPRGNPIQQSEAADKVAVALALEHSARLIRRDVALPLHDPEQVGPRVVAGLHLIDALGHAVGIDHPRADG